MNVAILSFQKPNTYICMYRNTHTHTNTYTHSLGINALGPWFSTDFGVFSWMNQHYLLDGTSFSSVSTGLSKVTFLMHISLQLKSSIQWCYTCSLCQIPLPGYFWEFSGITLASHLDVNCCLLFTYTSVLPFVGHILWAFLFLCSILPPCKCRGRWQYPSLNSFQWWQQLDGNF